MCGGGGGIPGRIGIGCMGAPGGGIPRGGIIPPGGIIPIYNKGDMEKRRERRGRKIEDGRERKGDGRIGEEG